MAAVLIHGGSRDSVMGRALDVVPKGASSGAPHTWHGPRLVRYGAEGRHV